MLCGGRSNGPNICSVQHSPNIVGPCCMMLCGGRSNGSNIMPTFFNNLRENWEREPGSLHCITRVLPYCFHSNGQDGVDTESTQMFSSDREAFPFFSDRLCCLFSTCIWLWYFLHNLRAALCWSPFCMFWVIFIAEGCAHACVRQMLNEVIKRLQHDPTFSRTKEMLERCWSKVWTKSDLFNVVTTTSFSKFQHCWKARSNSPNMKQMLGPFERRAFRRNQRKYRQNRLL